MTRLIHITAANASRANVRPFAQVVGSVVSGTLGSISQPASTLVSLGLDKPEYGHNADANMNAFRGSLSM